MPLIRSERGRGLSPVGRLDAVEYYWATPIEVIAMTGSIYGLLAGTYLSALQLVADQFVESSPGGG